MKNEASIKNSELALSNFKALLVEVTEEQALDFLKIIMNYSINTGLLKSNLARWESNMIVGKIRETVAKISKKNSPVSLQGSHFDLDCLDPENHFSSLAIPKDSRMFGVSSKR